MCAWAELRFWVFFIYHSPILAPETPPNFRVSHTTQTSALVEWTALSAADWNSNPELGDYLIEYWYSASTETFSITVGDRSSENRHIKYVEIHYSHRFLEPIVLCNVCRWTQTACEREHYSDCPCSVYVNYEIHNSKVFSSLCGEDNSKLTTWNCFSEWYRHRSKLSINCIFHLDIQRNTCDSW